MTIFSGEAKGGDAYLRGGAYSEFHIQQGRLIEGGRLIEEIRYLPRLLGSCSFLECMTSRRENTLLPIRAGHIVKAGLDFGQIYKRYKKKKKREKKKRKC